MIEYALQHIDIAPLMAKIREIIDIFGGVVYAFDMEWKIRVFVVAVLDFCLGCNSGGVSLDTEILKKGTGLQFQGYE